MKSISTAALEHTVVRRAVVCVGDLAYMSGIHAWNGTVPSLVPKAMNRRNTTTDVVVWPMTDASPVQSLMTVVPETIHRYAYTPIRMSPPTWVMAKNLHLGVSSSVSPMRKVTMDTISHAMSRRMTVSAIMHRTHERNRAQVSPM